MVVHVMVAVIVHAGRLRKEDGKFESSLVKSVRSCFKIKFMNGLGV